MINLKRAHEPSGSEDGERYLVDHIWPRGISKERAQLTGWLKVLAPSTELRKWFGHDPDRWEEFRRRYREELEDTEKQAALQDLVRKARERTVTLVFAARDTEHNNAVALKEYVEDRFL